MSDKQDKPKRRRGRPPKRVVEPIPDSFENVLKAVVQPLPATPADEELAGKVGWVHEADEVAPPTPESVLHKLDAIDETIEQAKRKEPENEG